jgi:hypothetical protein
VPPAPPTPTYRVSTYTVFPSGYDKVDDPSRSRWCLTVADAGDGWVIRRGDECLNFFNQWERELPPELRDAEFRRLCLYNEHAALLRARRVIDSLDVGGFTFEEFVWQVHVAASEDASDRNDRAVDRQSRPRDPSGPGGRI